MSRYFKLLSICLIYLPTSSFILADEDQPCPPPVPGIAEIVDTEAKCACFYALASSGLQLGDSSTFEGVFTDETVQTFSQTGKYYGVDGISEYLSFVAGGTYVKDYNLVGVPTLLDMSETTSDKCVSIFAERRSLPFNRKFTQGNVPLCVDAIAGARVEYNLTGDPDTPVVVKTINVWLPDEIISETFPYLSDSPATKLFICKTLVEDCDNEVENKARKILQCVRKYNELPSVDTINGLTYIDGNSKGCRILHSSFAKTNNLHCPHISFEADEDANGFVKCNISEELDPYSLFPEGTIELFLEQGVAKGLGPTAFALKEGGGCPPRFGGS